MSVLIVLSRVLTWGCVVLAALAATVLFYLKREMLEAIYGYEHLTYKLRKDLVEKNAQSQQLFAGLCKLCLMCSLVLGLICGFIGAGWCQLMVLAAVIVAMVIGALSLKRSESARWHNNVH